MALARTANDERRVGGFTRRDGTIAFYNRVAALTTPESVVLDLGAGRGIVELDSCEYRRQLTILHRKAAAVVAADVDTAVLDNTVSDRQIVIDADGLIPIEDSSVDLVLADNVLEHVGDPASFVEEVSRVLRSSGWFCARTPNSIGYIALASRLVPNRLHYRVVSRLQPGSLREERDVFPTYYRMNSPQALRSHLPFQDWTVWTIPNRPDPAYTAGLSALHYAQLALGSLPGMSPMWHVFAQRK